MKKVLLISEKQIKDLSIIEHNADAKVLAKTTVNVQEVQLKSILGKDLYETVIDAVNANIVNATPIPSSTKTLLDDYIVPFMVYAVLADFIVINNYKLTNKGLMKVSDNAGQNVNADELEYVKNYYDNYVSTYKRNLIEYLKDEQLTDCSTDTNITSNSIGWFLD